MRTMNFAATEISNINARLNVLKMVTINDACTQFKKRDINERENKALDMNLRKINTVFNRLVANTKDMKLRPLMVKILNDRIDIYDKDEFEKITTIVGATPKDVVDEIRNISPDWKRYVNGQIIMNGGDTFKMDSRYELTPNRNVKIKNLFKILNIDSNVLTIM